MTFWYVDRVDVSEAVNVLQEEERVEHKHKVKYLYMRVMLQGHRFLSLLSPNMLG